MVKKLELEINKDYLSDTNREGLGYLPLAIVTPDVGEDDYWIFRVKLSEKQSIIGFPKFATIGIGFKEEEDWNRNLPFRKTTKEIFDWIKKNKGDDSISDKDCILAIKMIQDASAKMIDEFNREKL